MTPNVLYIECIKTFPDTAYQKPVLAVESPPSQMTRTGNVGQPDLGQTCLSLSIFSHTTQARPGQYIIALETNPQ